MGAGLWWAEYRAPRGGAAAPDVVEVTRGEGRRTERERLEVPLAVGAPAAIEVALEREPVPLGATVAADAWARDARGDRLGPAEPARAGEGGFASPGRFTARRAPDGWVQREPLVYAAPAAREVARVALRREGRAWVAEARSVDGRPVPGAALRFGSGARAVTDARGAARVGAGGDEETVEAEGGARAAGWAGVEPPPWPAEVRATVEVRLRPPARVDVVASASDGVLRWRVEGADGEALRGRRVLLRPDGVALGPVGPDGPGQRCAVTGRGVVAVVDAESGVTAVVEVR